VIPSFVDLVDVDHVDPSSVDHVDPNLALCTVIDLHTILEAGVEAS